MVCEFGPQVYLFLWPLTVHSATCGEIRSTSIREHPRAVFKAAVRLGEPMTAEPSAISRPPENFDQFTLCSALPAAVRGPTIPQSRRGRSQCRLNFGAAGCSRLSKHETQRGSTQCSASIGQ